jgi:hypothetical protein
MMVFLTSMQPVFAKDEQSQAKPDISFIEFLGEGVDVDKEYVDPLQVKELEEMMRNLPQEGKQQND